MLSDITVAYATYNAIQCDNGLIRDVTDEAAAGSEILTEELFLELMEVTTAAKASVFITGHPLCRFLRPQGGVIAEKYYCDEFVAHVDCLKYLEPLYLRFIAGQDVCEDLNTTPYMKYVFGANLVQIVKNAWDRGDIEARKNAEEDVHRAFIELNRRFKAMLQKQQPCAYLVDAMWLYAYRETVSGYTFRRDEKTGKYRKVD